MRFLLLILTLSFVFFGCASSLPPAIPEEFLENTTSEETKNLEEVELQIISKPDEKVEALKKTRISKIKIGTSNREINQLETNKKNADALKKQHEAKKEMEDVAKQIEIIADLDRQIAAETIHLKFLTALNVDQQAQVDLINAELATLIARQRLIQAKIGRQNQDKMLGQLAPGVKNKDRIDIGLYENYLATTSQKLAGAKEKKGKASQLLDQAEAIYQKSKQQQEAEKTTKASESALEVKAEESPVSTETTAPAEKQPEETISASPQEQAADETQQEAAVPAPAPAE